MGFRIGHGYDVHRFAPDRRLILGGVDIPHELGLLGHSDADVLLHSVMDAVLGALALGDIGKHFPDTDAAHKNADSLALLEKTVSLMSDKNYRLCNLDATIVAQRPRLAPYIPAMRENIARVFAVDTDRISVKATTEEGLGFTGEGLGIASHAVILLEEA